jgi:hypothetical protein
MAFVGMTRVAELCQRSRPRAREMPRTWPRKTASIPTVTAYSNGSVSYLHQNRHIYDTILALQCRVTFAFRAMHSRFGRGRSVA